MSKVKHRQNNKLKLKSYYIKMPLRNKVKFLTCSFPEFFQLKHFLPKVYLLPTE